MTKIKNSISQLIFISQASDAHVEKLFFGGGPGGTVFQARYLNHKYVFAQGTRGRAELIHFRYAVIGAIEHINVTAVKDILLFRNHAKCCQGAIIELGGGF